MTAFDVQSLRAQFPALDQSVNDRPLIYLDNAATTQKPLAVLEALDRYYRHNNANVHRAVHTLSSRATQAYEGARDRIQQALNAPSRESIIFTRGTTEAINLVARSVFQPRLAPGDEILLTELEHHSNIVPWQLVAAATGARIKVAPILDDGSLDLAGFTAQLSARTRLVAVGESSNAIGTRNPIRELARLSHDAGALILVDAAQAMAHHPLDVQDLDIDFLAFSAHKMFGPTGFGALYAREALMAEAEPWQGGGDMIETVSFEGSTWNVLPYRFEAGTPNIAGAVATAAAFDFLDSLDREALQRHEDALLSAATHQLSAIPGLRLVGTAPEKAAIVSFVMEGPHPQDIGTLLDENGIAVRTGHHCAMPLMARFGLPGTARASFAAYNTLAEVEQLSLALQRIARLFKAA